MACVWSSARQVSARQAAGGDDTGEENLPREFFGDRRPPEHAEPDQWMIDDSRPVFQGANDAGQRVCRRCRGIDGAHSHAQFSRYGDEALAQIISRLESVK